MVEQLIVLTNSDVQESKKLYNGFNQLYKRFNLEQLTQILYMDSGKGNLLPFLKLKHAQIDYHNLSGHTESIQTSQVLKSLSGINYLHDVSKFEKKYDILISDSPVVVEKLLQIIKLKGYIITTLCRDIFLPGIDKVYKDDLCTTIYRKSHSHYTIKDGNEFKDYVQPVNLSYDIIEPKNIDVSIIFSKVNNKRVRINIIRFDSEDVIDESVKLRLHSTQDPSNSVELSVNVTNETVNVSEHDIPFELEVPESVTSNKSVIPKVICQTLNDNIVGEMHNRTVLNLKLLNAEYEYVFFDAPARRKFISQNFHEMVLEVYDGLVSGAFKADVFRYCWLYVCGGVYIDCKMINRVPLRHFIKDDDETFLCRDRIPDAYQNCFIASAPKNTDILKCIGECVDRFKLKINKRVSFGSLYHTGPYLFYHCMQNTDPKCEFKGPFNSKNYSEHTIRCLNTNDILFNMWYKNYYMNYKSLHQRPIWSEQWAKNEIYYSDKFRINNLKNYSILIYPNQIKSTDDLSDLTFEYSSDAIWNSKFQGLKCQLIDETNHIEQLIYVKQK